MAYRLTHCDEEPEYRYALTARTDAAATAHLVVIQCNPNAANGVRSDPTVGKVARRAEAAGFGEVTFLNLFARRSARVEAIRGLSYTELVGPRNDAVLAAHVARPAVLVLAWGALLPVPRPAYDRRLLQLRAVIGEQRRIYGVGPLVGGCFPRHGRAWNQGSRSLHQLTWRELSAVTGLAES